jgi:hypothetical protein
MESGIVDHPDPDAAENDLDLIGRAPIAYVGAVAVAHNRCHGGQCAKFVEYRRVSHIACMKDVIRSLEIRPRAGGHWTLGPPGVRV